jgi:hypothetical protein
MIIHHCSLFKWKTKQTMDSSTPITPDLTLEPSFQLVVYLALVSNLYLGPVNELPLEHRVELTTLEVHVSYKTSQAGPTEAVIEGRVSKK